MSDGYNYTTRLLGAANVPLDILDVSRLLTFSSSAATAIAMGTYGDATLLGNAATAVTLTATTQTTCAVGAALTDTLSAYANLNPAELDVDVGEPFGLQVQQQTGLGATATNLQPGDSFTLDVRVGSTRAQLIAFQVCSLICKAARSQTHAHSLWVRLCIPSLMQLVPSGSHGLSSRLDIRAKSISLQLTVQHMWLPWGAAQAAYAHSLHAASEPPGLLHALPFSIISFSL